MPTSNANSLLSRVRSGDQSAWRECIQTYEGRLLAFVDRRLHNRASAEDVVQESFIGFLIALPHFDESRTSVEAFLFSIAAHKLADDLRRRGRRPVLPLLADESGADPSIPGRGRVASSIARSRERNTREEQVLSACLRELIIDWKLHGQHERLRCAELLFARGLANKDVAERLSLTEQTVANHKSFVVQRLKDAARAAGLAWTPVDES